MATSTFALDNEWRLILKDLKIDTEELLQRAQLPQDLFSRGAIRMEAEPYFRLWNAFDTLVDDPELALRIGEAISVEHFNPPIFAAFCSENMLVAAQRLSQFKRLICPMRLLVEHEHDALRITYESQLKLLELPKLLVVTELVFLAKLIQIGTREPIQPIRVLSTFDLSETEGFAQFFGTPVELGETNTIVFAKKDAEQPFLTANKKMWDFFAPELRKRLSQLDESATTAVRVTSSLLELLPSGQASVQKVAKSLHVSPRTLQRHLQREGTSFQIILNKSREQLARHYLKHSTMSGSEISFLLGFDEPSSFFRAFQSWTGETPERVRASYQIQ